MSPVYVASLLLAGGISLGFAIHALTLRLQSGERRYAHLSMLAALEAAYCVVAWGYFLEDTPSAALPWGRAICVFTPFITYLFLELVMNLTSYRPRWLDIYQRLNLVFTALFAAGVILDGVLETAVMLTGVVETDVASLHRHRLEFAPIGQAWLGWVSMTFTLCAVILFRGYQARGDLLPMVVGCVLYFGATISDFGILVDRYDAYFVQHFGFFALVAGTWRVLARRYERSLSDLQSAVVKLEEQRRRLLLSPPLIQQHRLEAIGSLAAGVAHEINNPIHAVLNYARLLAKLPDTPTQAKEFSEEIITESERIAEIVRTLLRFSRAAEHQLGTTSVRALVDETLALTSAALLKEDVQVEVDLDDELPELEARSEHLKHVLMNLIANARDALTARSPQRRDERRLRITARAFERGGEPWVALSVWDNGDGIDEHIREHVFDPFFTTKPQGEGTGLGLSLSLGIVSAHGGSLSCVSTPGEDTCLTIEVPTQASTVEEEHPSRHSGQRRVEGRASTNRKAGGE